ncbi:hypothetical protein D9M68_820860 [compost metagenome]
MKNHGERQGGQWQQDCRLAGNGRQRGKQNQCLHGDSCDDQSGNQCLQRMLCAFVDDRCQQQAGQAQQCQVDGIRLLQVGQGFGTQAWNKGQQEGGDARQEMDDFQHVIGSP